MSKKELDKFHYHELLDRLHVTMENLDRNIVEHPVIDKHPEWRDKINSAIDILFDVYQEVGKKDLDK